MAELIDVELCERDCSVDPCVVLKPLTRGSFEDMRPMRGDLVEHDGELWEIVNVVLPKTDVDPWRCVVEWWGDLP